MNDNEIPIIDLEEMAEFITDELINQGTIANKEYILKVLLLEDEFLRIKGVMD